MPRLARSLALLVLLVPLASLPAAAEDAGTTRTPEDQARRAQAIVRGQGIEITVGEVEDAIAQQGPAARVRYKDRAQLEALVRNLSRAELLAAEAARRGYETHPAVRYTVKDSAAQALVREEVEGKITPDSISRDDVRAYYEAHPQDFHRDPMRRASVIVLDSAEEAQRLLPEAQKADARGFSELAKQHSKDEATKAKGGDVGYFAREPLGDGSEGAIDPAVRKAAFALGEIGDTSAVQIEGRHALVRLSGERPERHVTLDDAAPSIRAKLWRERRQQALDALFSSLRARDKPEVYESRVHAISFDDMKERPSGFAPDPAPPPSGGSPAPAH